MCEVRCRDLGVSPSTFYKYVERFQGRGVEGFFPVLAEDLTPVLVGCPRAWRTRWSGSARRKPIRAGTTALTRCCCGCARNPVRGPGTRRCPREPRSTGSSRPAVCCTRSRNGVHVSAPGALPARRSTSCGSTTGSIPPRRGATAVVLHLNDDCSRVDLALQAVLSENGADVWDTFCLAVARYGLPVAVLNDNWTAFSGRRRGWTSAFEQRLIDLCVQPICSSVQHPQTCGKNERAHQRVLKWLEKRPLAHDLANLQALLDVYREAFNSRGSQVHDALSPNQRFDLGPLTRPEGVLEPSPTSPDTQSAPAARSVSTATSSAWVAPMRPRLPPCFATATTSPCSSRTSWPANSPSTEAAATKPKADSVRDVLRHM